MKIKLDPANPQTWPKGRISAARLDAQTEADVAAQQASDDASAMKDAAKCPPSSSAFGVDATRAVAMHRRVAGNYPQLGTMQTQHDGAAKGLLRLLDRAPKAALGALV